jgi:hypothetical protein
MWMCVRSISWVPWVYTSLCVNGTQKTSPLQTSAPYRFVNSHELGGLTFQLHLHGRWIIFTLSLLSVLCPKDAHTSEMMVSVFWVHGLILEVSESIHCNAKNPKHHIETSLSTTEIIRDTFPLFKPISIFVEYTAMQYNYTINTLLM